MNQNLSLYRIFYTAALTGNISKAAEELFISQPAISKSIKRLEQSMGTTLFTRSSRGVQLTEDGELLFQSVKSAFQTLEVAEQQLKLRRELGIGHLRIGVSSTLCKYVLMPYLKDFVKLYPHIRVTITCQATHHTLQMLEDSNLDLGLIGKPEQLRNMQFFSIKEIQDTFVTSREYLENLSALFHLQGKTQLNASDVRNFLKSGTLMLLDNDNLSRQYLNNYLKSNQLFPENILETTSMDLLIDFARIGLGIACVIREFVKEELEEGSLIELFPPFPMDTREIGFIWKANATHTEAELFLQSLPQK